MIRRRILMVTECLTRGGLETRLLTQARELERKGREVFFATSSREVSGQAERAPLPIRGRGKRLQAKDLGADRYSPAGSERRRSLTSSACWPQRRENRYDRPPIRSSTRRRAVRNHPLFLFAGS